MDTSSYKAVAAGAVAAVTGLDQLLPAPPIVHWALAGAATDVYSKGGLDEQLILCALGGMIGGYTVLYIMG